MKVNGPQGQIEPQNIECGISNVEGKTCGKGLRGSRGITEWGSGCGHGGGSMVVLEKLLDKKARENNIERLVRTKGCGQNMLRTKASLFCGKEGVFF
jgi:hypothetical protein